jgi:hypothetical protein
LRACWRRPSAWGWRVAGKRRSSLSQTRGQRPTCPPLGRRRLARQPTRRRLLLGHGCPASSSVGGEGDGTNLDVVLPSRGEDVIDSAAGGQADGRHCPCRAAGEGVSCHSCRRGPETEHRPGLERLLETTHLELDGKLFVNTQQAPTWRANCRRFDTGGSLDRRVNCHCVSQPRWVGARWNTRGKTVRGNRGLMLSCAQSRCACSRGLQAFAWERESVSLCVSPSSRAATFSYESPGPSFYRCKERAQVYNGGVAMC